MTVTLERLDHKDDAEFIVETPELKLANAEFLIGRAVDCNLQLECAYISRHHCELIVDDRRREVRVRDLGSQNGTFVNDAEVERECRLQDGDRLRVAYIPFRVHIG